MKTARNIAIIAVIAAGVAFVPGGGVTAAVINGVLYEIFAIIVVVFAVRFYVEHRVEIFSLGDRDRLLVYSALGAVVLAFAGRPEWVATGAGTVAFVALLGFAVFAAITVFQRWRAYR
jgi:hypothetical protein